jgi:ribonuclease-3
VLGLIATEFVYQNCPDRAEGDMTMLKVEMVDKTACANYCKKLDVLELVRRGSDATTERSTCTVMADLLEAILGAICSDSDFETAKRWFFHWFAEEIHSSMSRPALHNFKAHFQSWSQAYYKVVPKYNVVGASGPDHLKTFTVFAYVNDVALGKGSGQTKKAAEQAAAENALKHVQELMQTKKELEMNPDCKTE